MALLDYFRNWFGGSEADLQKKLEELRQKAPIPIFWLLGKPQTGKTSIIKYLTGAEEAEIGSGFRPTTKLSRQYHFPTEDPALMTFLDTRGIEEVGYELADDLRDFGSKAHLVLVTIRALDHAQERVVRVLRAIRADNPTRPVILVFTCLHEAYPQQQHPRPYPFGTENEERAVPENLRRSLAEHRQTFEGLFDHSVAVDLTRPGEGFEEPNYGGEVLKKLLISVLPSVYAQTLVCLEEAKRELSDLHAQRAMPTILAYSALAASVGAVPIPVIDLFVLPGIQTRMIYALAQQYGQPLSGKRFLEMAATLGIGILVRQAIRNLAKLVPVVGSVTASVLAASSTFALGKAFCHYYSAVLGGHAPKPEELRKYYQEELNKAERMWKSRGVEKKGVDPQSNTARE